MMNEQHRQVFEPDLFNTVEYARLHAHRSGAGVLRYDYRRPDEQAVAGVFQAVRCDAGVFTSPGRGPYGGFDASPGLTDAELMEFVSLTETALCQHGARRVDVVLPPFCYNPQLGPRILSALCHAGYRVTRQELNQALALDPDGSASHANHAARKRLNRARRAGVAARSFGRHEYRAGYDAIVENRRKKGRSLSMSWNDVLAMADAFPARVHVFGAEQDSRVLAAAICVAVSTRVLYVYAWGEIAGAEPVSPVSVLADHLADFARERGFGLLDLGTSSVEGIVNPGLLAFKRSLGADDSLKLWLTKVLG